MKVLVLDDSALIAWNKFKETLNSYEVDNSPENKERMNQAYKVYSEKSLKREINFKSRYILRDSKKRQQSQR